MKPTKPSRRRAKLRDLQLLKKAPPSTWGSVFDVVKQMERMLEQEEIRTYRKAKLIELKGGRCERCEQTFHPDIYDFHHRDPSKKEFSVSKANLLRDWQSILGEADKCHLLCKNCHAEVHTYKDMRFLEDTTDDGEG